MIMISTTIYQNITKELEKIHILFLQLWGYCCCPRCYMPLTGKKRYYKITADHK